MVKMICRSSNWESEWGRT